MKITAFCPHCGAQTTSKVHVKCGDTFCVCCNCGGQFGVGVFYRYVDKKTAEQIINQGKPQGLFVFDTDIELIGIDNRSGIASVEEFPDKWELDAWLEAKIAEEPEPQNIDNYTIEYCPFCDSEVVIYSTGITACPECGKPLAPCSMCSDCIDPCPYGCKGDSSDEFKAVTNPLITPEEIDWVRKHL